MATRFTVHMVHHPEITFDSPTEASGRWTLQDIVIDTEHGFTLRGASHYEDRYRKEADGWRISATGYQRIYEEMETRDRPGLTLLQNRFA